MKKLILLILPLLAFIAACEGDGFLEKATADEPLELTSTNDRLINGTPVQPGAWKSVIHIVTGSAGCTATLVGPKVIITAAHCAGNGQTAVFTLDGKQYQAKMSRSSLYPSKDHDVAVGVVNAEPPNVPLSQIGGKAVVGNPVWLLGYGCTQPGGGGGNDGVLREGGNKVTGFSGFDVVSGPTPGGAALCFGDSGGPVFDTAGRPTGNPPLLAINSKGNIKDQNYTTRLDIPESQDFLKQFAAANSVEICGINKDCGTGPGSVDVTVTDGLVGKIVFSVKKEVFDKLGEDYIKVNTGNLMRYFHTSYVEGLMEPIPLPEPGNP